MSKGGLLGNPIKAITGAIKNPLNALGSTLDNPIVNAAEAFIPGVGPLVAGASNATGNLLQGKSLGRSLGSGALAGGEAFLGDELGSAAQGAFPETFSAFSDAIPNLGIGDALSGVGDSVSSDYHGLLDTLGLNGASAGAGGAGGDIAAGASGTTSSITPLSLGSSAGLDLTDSAATAAAAPQSYLPQGFNLNPTAAGGATTLADPFAASAATPFTGSTGASALSGSGSQSFGDMLKGLPGKAVDAIGKNPIAALSAAGLGANAIAGSKKTGAEKNLSAISDQQQATGSQLITDAQAGRLPAGMDASIEQQMQDSITGIKNKYAQLGMSGSSSEQAEIGRAQQQAGQYRSQQLQQILTQGLGALGSASSTDQQIVQNQLSGDKNLYEAIAALSGLGGSKQKQDQPTA